MTTRSWKWIAVALPLAAAAASAATPPAPDPVGQHNMLMVGEKAVFLSHLPMFVRLDSTGAEYDTEHRYQAILEVGFEKNGRDVTRLYTDDRRRHPAERMYTVEPTSRFVLPEMLAGKVSRAGRPVPPSFGAKAYRGHLERGGVVIPGLDPVSVKVRRVVHLHRFRPSDARRDTLAYILFGRGGELFMAHTITRPPDFDQILPVTVTGHAFTDAELEKGVEVVFAGRSNTASGRLRAGEEAAGRFRVAGAPQSRDVRVRGGRELYFEEGELGMPDSMDPTAEERRSGF
ncbi:MAG TPA: hypothetical protein VFQ76_13385 [Longimicrobiaceae bacterium]|nr:hypothetical protein [Longimicrobiaceae bacterium]